MGRAIEEPVYLDKGMNHKKTEGEILPGELDKEVSFLRSIFK